MPTKKKTTTTSKKTGGRPPKGTATKSDFIREKLKAGMSPTDIVKAAAEANPKVVIAPAMVYKVRSRLTAKKPGAAKAKPGPKPSKGTAAPKTGGKLSKSDFIRQYPDKSANEIVALGKKASPPVKFSANAVYTVRGYDKKRSGGPKGKPGRKPAPKYETPKFQVFPGGGGSEADLKKAALAVGFPRALEVVAELGKKAQEIQRQYQALMG
jgi:hypothetical protein